MTLLDFSLDHPSATPLLLVEELNHRVINQYTQAVALVRRARDMTQSLEAGTALDAVADRLCDHAVVHRLQLPVGNDHIDLSGHLERLCSAMSLANLKERGILLSLMAESVVLEPGRCWRVALVVAELINNAARHALTGGGAVLVIMEEVGDIVACRVMDNGGVERPPVASRGMAVVRGLAADLHGDVRWTFGRDGSRAELTFPKIALAPPFDSAVRQSRIASRQRPPSLAGDPQ